MKMIIVIVFIVMVTLSVAGPSTVKVAVSSTKEATCTSCHIDFQDVISEKHPAVSGDDLQACLSCHKSIESPKAEPNAFSAKVHRVHLKESESLDCTECHSWASGKAFSLTGTDVVYGHPSERDMDLLKKAFSSWAHSPYLDSIHGAKNVTCRSCHGNVLPTLGDIVENERCLTCHGTYDSLAKKTTPLKFSDRNPHNSHLGVINCTVCHFAHSESRSYCLECHQKFEMTIPGSGQQSPSPQN
jgi:hypothetical protein